jgi:hypothetical protein
MGNKIDDYDPNFKVDLSKENPTNCCECTSFRPNSHLAAPQMWYNHYCAAAPHSEQEKAEILRKDRVRYAEWAKETHNGQLCRVPFAPGSGSPYGPPEGEVLDFRQCVDVKGMGEGGPCDLYTQIPQMEWRDFLVIFPRKIEGRWVMFKTVRRRKRREINGDNWMGEIKYRNFWEYKLK